MNTIQLEYHEDRVDLDGQNALEKYNLFFWNLYNAYNYTHHILAVIGKIEDDNTPKNNNRRINFFEQQVRNKFWYREMGFQNWLDSKKTPVFYCFEILNHDTLNSLIEDWFKNEWDGLRIILVNKKALFQLDKELFHKIVSIKADFLSPNENFGIEVICDSYIGCFIISSNSSVLTQLQNFI